MFCVTHDIVSRIANSTTQETRESGQVDGLVAADAGIQDLQRIRIVDLLTVAVSGFHDNGSSACSDCEERMTSNETVSPDFFAADNTFEQECK